jgi:hypothetical protein
MNGGGDAFPPLFSFPAKTEESHPVKRRPFQPPVLLPQSFVSHHANGYDGLPV